MSNTQASITEYILKNVEKHSSDLVAVVAKKYGFSRQRAHTYVEREVRAGRIIQTGKTRATKYFLANGQHIEFEVDIEPDLAEDQVWSKYVKPIIREYPDNVYRICNYGFTEIFNNAIDHSEGARIFTDVKIRNGNIEMSIYDNGIGIFKKIQNALRLESMRESVLHLAKGKFTTDPEKHSGQGIFFTSRIFDDFTILSNNLFYSFQDEDWFLSSEKLNEQKKGTMVSMSIAINSNRTPREVFDTYSDVEMGFKKTKVAVRLSANPDDSHVSRSEAKRLLMGLDKFKTVVLDFEDIQFVGQAFVDEVFRVFNNEYPHTDIHYINANEDVEFMIQRSITNQQ